MIRRYEIRLFASLSGALEPGRELELGEDLLRDPLLLIRLQGLQAQLQAPAPDPGRWRLPPPGLQVGGLSAHWAPAMVMSGALRPGDRFLMRLAPPQGERGVVVLYRPEGGEWRVVFPETPEELLLLSELPSEGGSRTLELMAGPDPGLQRWAVALPPEGAPLDWGAASSRWNALRQSLAAGQTPVTTVEIQVEAPR